MEREASREEAGMTTVWIYTDTSKQVGDPHHLLVFATQDSADAWLEEFDREGVAFEYPVIGKEAAN
jgi:hypothetical protein